MSERTLQATARRRKEARAEGRVVASPQIVGAITWLAVAAVMCSSSGLVLSTVRNKMAGVWSEPQTVDGLADWLHGCMGGVSIWLLPILLAVFFLAVISRIAQTGFVWVPTRVLPQANRINATQRMQNMFSMDRFVDVLRGMFVVVGGLSLVVGGMWLERDQLVELLQTGEYQGEAIAFMSTWGLRIGGLLGALALLDYALQRHRFEKSLRMTPEELRAEVRGIEGNPAIAAGRRQLQQSWISDSDQRGAEDA